MLDAERLTKLAEAVADGQTPDWSSADHLPADDRDLIAELRAVASIGALFGTISGSGPSSKAATPRLTPGSTWGTLHILEHVGAGRFGDVYRAWDPALDREVALKLMSGPASDDASDSQVVEEGRLMARVHHPNVVSVFGAQRIGETTGLWMEFVEGRTLADELSDRGPFGADDLVSVGVDLCRALQAVHEEGLVHRDVKTQNVMRDRRGRVVLGDFGVGRDLQDDEPAAGLAGTPAYIAPEIFARQTATSQSDIYSLGALLFHLATRRYPVEGRSLRSLRDAHESGARVSLATLRPDLPAKVTGVIDRALSVDPLARYATADEMAAAFEVTRATTSAHPTRRRQWAAAAVLVIAAAAAFSWVRPAPAPVIPFEAREWVLVTAATDVTGESVLKGTIEYMLERELSRSAFVNVIPRARVADVLQLMQKPPDTILDAATSREVALRDGAIRALVTGRIEKVGERYAIGVDIVSPSDGALLASMAEPPVAEGDLLAAIGRLALAIRERLGEDLPALKASRVHLAKVTTRSLKALQLFSQAVALQDEEGTFGSRAEAAVAEQLLRAAIAEDPGFASAHMTLSIAIRGPSPERLPEALEHVKQAIRLSHDVTEVERLVNEAELGIQAMMTVDLAERRHWDEYAIARYQAVLRLQPDHAQALICLINLNSRVGREDPMLAMRLADLRPHSSRWAAEATAAALLAGDLDGARRYARRPLAPAVTPAGVVKEAWLGLFDAYDAWLSNDVRKAVAIANRIAAQLPAMASTSLDRRRVDRRRAFTLALSRLYLTLGQFTRAEALLSSFPSSGMKHLALGIAMERRDPAHLQVVLAREYPKLVDRIGIISAIIDSGQIGQARVARDLFANRGINPAYLAYVDGQLALHDGALDEAITGIETYLRSHLDGHGHSVATKLAEALAARGDVPRAITLLESFEPHRRRLLTMSLEGTRGPWDWLPLRDRLALLYRQAGRHQDADVVEAELRALLAVADEDHPIRRRAMARLNASTASAASARAFNARDWVLVADTDNRTDAALDDAVRFALEQQLAASSLVRVVSRPRIDDVLQLMRRPLDTRLAPAVAREVAVRDGEIRAVLLPRLSKVGTTLTLAVDIIRPADAAVLDSVTDTSLSSLDTSDISRIARRVRERLGESFASIEPASEKLNPVATPSLRALHLYSRAWALAGEGPVFTNLAVVEQLLREAIREDPEFVAAHVLLAHALRQQPERRTEVIPQMKRAVEAAQNGRAEDRYLAQAEWHALLGMQFGEPFEQLAHVNDAMASFEALLQLRPDDQHALSWLLGLSRRAGKPAKTRTVMAARLVELRPNSVRALWDAAVAHADAGDIAAARRYAARAGTLNVPVTGSNAFPLVRARLFRAHDAWLRNDVHGARRALDALAAEVNALPAEAAPAFGSQLARAYESLGRLDAAEQMTAFQPEDTRRFTLLSVGMSREDPSVISAVLDARFPRPHIGTGSALVAAGRLVEARRVLNDAGGPDAQSYTLLLAGQIALAEGAADEAIAQLERLRRASLLVVPPHHWMLGTTKLAAAYATSGDVSTAIRTLEDETRNRHLALEPLLWGNLWLSLREQLAGLYRQAGRHRDADAVEAELRALLAVADDDHPIKRRLLQAR